MLRLVINYIVIYDFCGSASDVIHPSNPLHLIICFELFGHTFLFGKLVYQPKEHLLCLLVDIGKVSCELTACQQIGVADFVMLLDVTQMPLAPYSDFNLLLFGKRQARQVVIALQLIVNTCLFVVNSLFHCSLYIPPREHHLHGVLAPRSRCFSATLYGVEHHPL